jgi:predicted alpha/beta hydrolase
MMDNSRDAWPSPEQYGRRYDEINQRLAKSFVLAEYRGDSEDDVPVLQYRLAKLALAAEDIRAAIAILESEAPEDEAMAHAIVELRNSCGEVIDSFSEANDRLVRLLNFVSG